MQTAWTQVATCDFAYIALADAAREMRYYMDNGESELLKKSNTKHNKHHHAKKNSSIGNTTNTRKRKYNEMTSDGDVNNIFNMECPCKKQKCHLILQPICDEIEKGVIDCCELVKNLNWNILTKSNT